MAANHTALELQSFSWGFDPQKLLLAVSFPYDHYEAYLRRDRLARMCAIRLQEVVLPPEYGNVEAFREDEQLTAQLAREAAAITIQSAWKGHVTHRKYTLVRFGDNSAKTYGSGSTILSTTTTMASSKATTAAPSLTSSQMPTAAPSAAPSRPESRQHGLVSAGVKRVTYNEKSLIKESHLSIASASTTKSSFAYNVTSEIQLGVFSSSFSNGDIFENVDTAPHKSRKHDTKSKIIRDFVEVDVPTANIGRQANWHAKYKQMSERVGPQRLWDVNFEEFCSLKIQATWRMFCARRALKQTLEQLKNANTEAERADALSWLHKEQKKHEFAHLHRDQDKASGILQRAWRRYWKRKIYFFYRDLIKMRESRDPRASLKIINPKEAQLIDAAAGMHVRFRLGGDKFPPNIYYKIYVHNAMVDLNAFAPRDYHHTQSKKTSEYERFNTLKEDRSKPRDENDQTRWYLRFENNGWRPIVQTADPLEMMRDPIYLKSTYKKIPFNHSKLKRREDVTKQHKQRKIEWMKKMYSEQKEHDDEQISALSSEELALNSEDLLNWSEQLDFEQYSKDWAGLATSVGTILDSFGADSPIYLDKHYPQEIGRVFKNENDSESDDDNGTFAVSRAASARSTKSSTMDLSDLFLNRAPH